MVERWTASGLLWAESGYRRIRHYEDLPKLKEALKRSFLASVPASSLRTETSTPAKNEQATA